jgi:hypothetical protein
VVAVVAGGPGLVAVGRDDSGGDSDAAVWTSPDGLEWTRVPHDESIFGGPDDQVMRAVAIGGPGLIAVGSDSSNGHAAVWASSDGVAWYRFPDNDATFGGSNWLIMNAVVAGGSDVVAVGHEMGRKAGSADSDYSGAVWVTRPSG